MGGGRAEQCPWPVGRGEAWREGTGLYDAGNDCEHGLPAGVAVGCGVSSIQGHMVVDQGRWAGAKPGGVGGGTAGSMGRGCRRREGASNVPGAGWF